MITIDRLTGKLGWFPDPSAAAVSSVNGHTGAVVLTKSDVGLANVDNTSDASKPISTAAATALAAKADLVGGVVPTAQIPAIAITTKLASVGSQASMLALAGQEGDWTIRTDLGTTWIITGADPTQLSNWTALSYPTAPVQSVNGQTGVIVLTASDVGAQPADSDLTAIAALSTTSFGRGFLTLADDAASRTYIGAGTSSFSGLFTGLNFTSSNLTSIATRNFSDLQNIPARVLNATVFNVKDYGALGDGSTDDTTAISNALTAIPSTGGVLYFPASSSFYKVSGGFTIAKPITILGDGSGSAYDNSTVARSTISYSTTTGTLFTVTANGVTFKDIALTNPNTGTMTAGAGISVQGNSVTGNGNLTRYLHIKVANFYVGIDHQTGNRSIWEGCYFINPTLYGLKLQDVATNQGGGDSDISGCFFDANTKTGAGSAAIAIFGGGGFRFTHNKINGIDGGSPFWDYGVLMSLLPGAQSEDFLFCNNSVEGVKAGLYFTTQDTASAYWNFIVIGNQFELHGDNPSIYFNPLSSGVPQFTNIIVESNSTRTFGTNANPMIKVVNSSAVRLGLNNVYQGHVGTYSISNCTNVSQNIASSLSIGGDIDPGQGFLQLNNNASGGDSGITFSSLGINKAGIGLVGTNGDILSGSTTGDLAIKALGSGHILFGTNGVERARLIDTGFILASGVNQSITSPNAASLTMRSGGASNYTFLSLGRTQDEAEWCIAGSAGQFVSAAAAGDNIFKTLNSNFIIDTNWGSGTSVLFIGKNNGGVAIGSSTDPGAGNLLLNGLTASQYVKTDSSKTLVSASGVPVGDVSGLGTGVGTALGVNVGSAGAFVTNGGALGTPSSGTVTNLTGTASININGTVGATTPAAGTFTTGVFSTSITGGSSGLSLAAGGTNQNITLTPSGTGLTKIATGELRVGNSANLYAELDLYNSANNSLNGTTSGRKFGLFAQTPPNYGLAWGSDAKITWTSVAFATGSDSANAGSNGDTTFSRDSAGTLAFGTTAANALGSWKATNGTLSGTLSVTGASTLTGAVTQGAKTTTYNNIATVGNGIPSEVATIDSTGLTANVSASTLYAVPASGAGLYRVSAYLVTTTAASVSSTMPNAQVVYTDSDSNTSVTLDVSPILGAAGLGQSGLLTANAVGTVFSGTVVIYAKLSTTIQYQTVNYASTAGGMAYALRMKLEAL